MEDWIGMVDRISELPDFIIHQIMSYLSTKEAAQTCVLSKRWNHLRTSFPILDFDQVYFLGDLAKHSMYYFSVREKRRFCKRTVKFIGFVDASLLRFCELKVSMQKFRLSMSLFDVEGVTSLLDKWIELAVANEVQELDFNVETNRVSRYSLPTTIFSAKFLTTLKLSDCKVEQSSDTIRFHSLKKLALHRVHIGEQMVQKFISECPLLEDLILSPIWDVKRVCVSNLPELKIVTIGGENSELESIEIVAPSLQQCTLTCLCEPCVIDLAGCPHLNSLKLRSVEIEILDLISKIPMLEKLIVQDCEYLTEFEFSSNQLKDLQIRQCVMDVIDVDAPNLLSFSYECEVYPNSYSINVPPRCSCKLKFIINPPSFAGDLILSGFKLIKEEFIGVAQQVKELSMSINIMKSLDSFTLDEFRNRSPSLPREVENLIIDIQEVPPSKYAALLDCLLWVCFPRILSIKLKRQKQSIKFIKLFYEKLINSDTKCCNSHIIKCWQHYLKGYKIESFVPYNDPKPLRVDNLMVELPRLPEGTIRFQLEWCFFFTY